MGLQTFVSWNVNGLRAVVKKGFSDIFSALNADVVALQETKLQEGQIDLDFSGYHSSWNYAEKKGYSGTVVYSREEPLQVIRQIGSPEADNEGRVTALEFEKCWFVNVYTPNAQPELRRLSTRLAWDVSFRDFLCKLARDKPVVTCGDFNVAHNEIDLKNPDSNHENPGFSDAERQSFTKLLDAGFIDSFRLLHPNEIDAYSWWSYRTRARDRNIGWRIDYFLVGESLKSRVKEASIRSDIFGSDHCPVQLKLEL